jgi:acyl carrier protein
MIDTIAAAEEHVRRRDEILRRVRELLIRDLKVKREPDTIDPDTPLFATGLGLDSVDAVELVICLQREFNLYLADDQEVVRKTRTVNSIIDCVLACAEVAHAG